jgi:hypothetical protein
MRDVEPCDSSPMETPTMAQPAKKRSWKWLFWLVVVPILLFVAYTWFVLWWSFSEGERAGYVQKLSKRGWLCKTWEGELALITMPGTVAEKFYFTIRDEGVAQRVNAAIGQRVALTYRQHMGIPTNCFGDSQYFVNDVRVVVEPTLPPESPPRAAPGANAVPAPAETPATTTPAPPASGTR